MRSKRTLDTYYITWDSNDFMKGSLLADMSIFEILKVGHAIFEAKVK